MFPCAGEDEWLALEVEDAGQWAKLAKAIGEPWAAASGLDAEARRGANRKALHANLAAWTGARSREQLALVLRTAGIAAAPVHNEAELLFSEPFPEAGF